MIAVRGVLLHMGGLNMLGARWVALHDLAGQLGAGPAVRRGPRGRRAVGLSTDPISALTTLTTAERSGVVDILPWTASTLLVLEREFGGSFIPDFRSRLYGVDVAAASDVSALASLTGGGFTPLAKTLLWQGDFGTSNFEGMTFGPTLTDGWTSLLLVSDDGGGIRQDLYALAVVPEPSTWVMGAVGIAYAAWGALRRGTAR